MQLAFYPGCSLEGMASDYARSIYSVFRHLGIELVEIDDWSCCGATAAHSLSELMAVALPARNLSAAERRGLELVVPCANCFNRLRYSQSMIRKNIFDIPWPGGGRTKVHDMTRYLAENLEEPIRRRTVRSMNGMKVVAYYGCQMVRPPRITGYDDYENPQTLDLLAAAVGAEVIDWSYKATCCGASIGIGRRDIQESLTARLIVKAKEAGAEAVVVSCPLCQSNLDMIQKDEKKAPLPIFYFTELLQLALSEETADRRRFKSHVADPVPLLRSRKVLP